jgi:hypothetical protein
MWHACAEDTHVLHYYTQVNYLTIYNEGETKLDRKPNQFEVLCEMTKTERCGAPKESALKCYGLELAPKVPFEFKHRTTMVGTWYFLL